MNKIQNGILIHFGELSLKGKNRNAFIEKLKNNIEKKTGGNITNYHDRFFLTKCDTDKLDYIYGISWYSKAFKIKKDLKEIEKYVCRLVDKNTQDIKTFGLFIKRADKSFNPDSQELAQILGKVISETFKLKVNLNKPDLSIFIEIADEVFIHINKEKGLGGMPVGMGGRILSLLSGGIDSPVACCQMIKRGAEVDFLHFHALNSNENAVNSKIVDLAKMITRYQVNSKLYIVSYNDFQKEILKHTVERGYELVLFRRFMVKFAEYIANKENYQAICTGDSLSQVASQTIENISSVMSNLSIPVFQPLISMDKMEIIDKAKQIGTYETSIKKYRECCSLMSKNPRTKTRKNIIKEYEAMFNFKKIILNTYKNTDIVQIT